MKYKSWITGAMLAAASVIAPLVSAQQVATEATSAQGLEEVIVTAQFVRQNLQVTPVAITAVDAAMLESRGQVSVPQISAQAPNVYMTAGGAYGGPSLISFIRGVGQTDFNPALEPGVGLYVDDVYYSTLTGSVLDLLDLDRVEVQRGPQGTLSGKNSIGGAIKLYSKKPGDDSDAYVQAGYGSYNEVSVRAASSFTMIPGQLWARVSGVSRSSDGYVTRLDYGCTHPGSPEAAAFPNQVQGAGCTIGHEGGVKYTAGRVALRWLPIENLELNFAADALNDVSEPPANVLLGVGPTIAPVIVGGLMYPTVAFAGAGFPPGTVPPFFPGVTNEDGCHFIAYGPNSCDPKSPNNAYVNYSTYTDPNSGLTVAPNQTVNSRGYALDLDWQLLPELQLKSITAYRRYDSGFALDSDATPYALQNLYQSLTHNQTSQELRLTGKWGRLLDYTLGGFYFDQTSTETGRIDLAYVGFDFIHGPDPVDDKNWAAFGHGVVHMTDKMDLSLGIRYSHDKKTYTFARHNPDGSLIQPCIGPPGTPGNPPNCVISSLNGLSSTFDGSHTDYRAALSYRVTDEIMPYLQYSTGYKGGGVNPRPFFDYQAVTFQPETLDTFELGLKSQFLNNSLRVNAALFTSKYKDIQLTLNDCTALVPPGDLGVPCLAPANAGNADVKGAELEVNWQPVRGMQLDGSYSYLDFSYSSLNYDTAATGVTLSDVTPYTPKHKWSVGAQYEIPLGGAGTLTPRVDAHGQDKMYTDAPNTDLGTIDSYTLVNARLTWLTEKKDWSVDLECRNVSDKLYYTTKTNQVPALGGSAYGSPGLPRTWLFSVKRAF